VEGSGTLEAVAITSFPDKVVDWKLKPKGEVPKNRSVSPATGQKEDGTAPPEVEKHKS